MPVCKVSKFNNGIQGYIYYTQGILGLYITFKDLYITAKDLYTSFKDLYTSIHYIKPQKARIVIIRALIRV